MSRHCVSSCVLRKQPDTVSEISAPALQMAVLPAEAMTELLNEALSLFVLLNEGDQELDNALERVRRDSRVVAQATDDIRQVVLSAARSALQPIAIGVNGGHGRT